MAGRTQQLGKLAVYGESVVTARQPRKWQSCSVHILIYHWQHVVRFSICLSFFAVAALVDGKTRHLTDHIQRRIRLGLQLKQQPHPTRRSVHSALSEILFKVSAAAASTVLKHRQSYFLSPLSLRWSNKLWELRPYRLLCRLYR